MLKGLSKDCIGEVNPFVEFFIAQALTRVECSNFGDVAPDAIGQRILELSCRRAWRAQRQRHRA
jgi:hypothetical protein